MPLTERRDSVNVAGYDGGVAACLDEHNVAALAIGSGNAHERAAWLAHAESCERCRAVVAAAVRAHRDSGDAPTELARGSGGAPTEPARPAALRSELGTREAIGRYRITRVL